MSVRLTENERRVLAVLAPRGGECDWFAYTFKPLSERCALPRNEVRLACRKLARKGLAAFERGLWSEYDDRPAGAGYRATAAGVEAQPAFLPEQLPKEADYYD